MKFRTKTLVEAIEVSELYPLGRTDLELTARIELFQDGSGRYTCNVWFAESLRVTPTDSVLDNQSGHDNASRDMVADKFILCLVDALGFDDLSNQTLDGIREITLNRLAIFVGQRKVNR